MTEISTPDIADDFPDLVQAVQLQFADYGAISRFAGAAVTVKCFEDNSLVKSLVDTAGEGRVIVVDGGGSLRHALLGDMLAEKAAANGWSGLVINGAVRDVEQIAVTQLGVKALGATPLKTEKLGQGQQDVEIEIGGVNINSGDWIYADNNGVLVAPKALL
jgi:regulator of ribonuclease activity A